VSESLAELELAFSTQPIVGWRIWRVTRGIDRRMSTLQLANELLEAERRGEVRPVERLFRYRLRSLTQPGLWPPGRRLQSSCEREGVDDATHEAGPDAVCACGIWALRQRGGAERLMGSYRDSGGATALGRVALWGRIIEHENGWRGQFAYPLDVVVFNGTEEMARDIGDAYAVDVSLDHQF
jgi:hypothetical protein